MERPLPDGVLRSENHPETKLPDAQRTAAYGKRAWRSRRLGWVNRYSLFEPSSGVRYRVALSKVYAARLEWCPIGLNRLGFEIGADVIRYPAFRGGEPDALSPVSGSA